jgi:hypothetical protein
VEFVLERKYLAALVVLTWLTIECTACGILAGGVFMRLVIDIHFGVNRDAR